MMNIRELARRARHVLRRQSFDAELRDEMQFHMDMRAQELERAGASPRDAAEQARREFGSAARLAEDTGRAWNFTWIEDLLLDLRYALRSARRSPVFTLTVALSLAIGIGANSAVFTAVNAVLVRPLSVKEPESLASLTVMRDDREPVLFLPLEFVHQLESDAAFTDIIGQAADGLSFTYDGRAERIIGEAVTPNFFAALGVVPAVGRPFSVGSGAPAEAVLSYRFWQRRFGGDKSVIGKTIQLNAYPYTIAGVSPPSFMDLEQGLDPEVRIPILPRGSAIPQLQITSGADDARVLTMVRVAQGVSLAQAEAAATARFSEFRRTTANAQVVRSTWAAPKLARAARGFTGNLSDLRTPLLLLLGLSAIVFLAACANVAGMLLARASARRRELAMRVSLGAGRARIARQMFAEAFLASLMGGALAVPFAYATARMLPAFLPKGHLNLSLDLTPDARVMAFTAALAVLTGLIIGLAPALRSTSGNLTGSLKAESSNVFGDTRAHIVRRILVGTQVAFSVVIVVVAALFVRSLSDLRPSDFSGRTSQVLLFTMKPQPELYTKDRVRAITSDVVRRVSALPGVTSAALAETGPLSSRAERTRVKTDGHEQIDVATDDITPGFFETVGLRIAQGRDFRAGDAPGGERVAIISDALAKKFFGTTNALGRTITIPADAGNVRSFQIIGVAADVHYHDLHAAPPPIVWLGFQDSAPYMPTLHVRTTNANSGAMIAAIMKEFDAVDKGFPVFNVRTLDDRVNDALSSEHMVSALASVFGALVLLLAGVGLYSILAYAVARRTREIGLRIALGSSVRAMLWAVASDTVAVIVAGIASGAVLAFLGGTFITRSFPGVRGADALALGAAAAATLVIAAAAVTIPSLRATRVDPLLALRTD
ncbi:MAG TPA: ADOP family duplicated permease [Gemmatimonadaceae bacterium]|nr:ADOP family duplicated permease [Gemmatimonadaceae bacterium]